MANLDGIKGIGGDRAFMDAYYMYTKLKKELNENKGENNQRENIELHSCHCYLIALDRCLTKINSLPDGDVKRNYLDWLRWKTGIIVAELERFEAMAHLQHLVPTISGCKKVIETVLQRYFQLAEDEKAVSNQYVHAYASIRQRQSVNAYNRTLQHSGRLLINYVNYLKDRCYVDELDRSETSIDQLQGEANYLMTGLRGVDDDLATNIKTAIEQYALFRELDNAADVSQDDIMEHAVFLAHKRATEKFLETVERRIREKISLIKQKTIEKLQRAYRPILHPIDTFHDVKDLVNDIRSNGLLKTLKEIWKWAKENPWKCAAVVLGSIGLGACIVGLPLAGLAFAADFALNSIAISPAVLAGAGSVGTVISAVPIVLTAVTVANVSHIKAKSQLEIDILKEKEVELMNENEVEGRKIAYEVKYDRIRRDYHKKADELADEKIRQIREERQLEEATKLQINSMELQQLSEAESQLRNGQEELQTIMRAIQSEEQLRQEQFLLTQRDNTSILEGRAATARVMARCARKSTATNCKCDNE